MNLTLTLTKYRFLLKFQEEALLPRYKGSSLRGGFGRAFRRTACTLPMQDCGACLLKETCTFCYIFRTPVPAGAKILSRQEQAPRPFIIEPPMDGKRLYRRGETLTMNLILIGRASDFFPYFLLAFRELGKIGLTGKRARFALSRIDALDRSGKALPIYSEDGALLSTRFPIELSASEEGDGSPERDTVALEFLTPTQIIFEGKPAGPRLEFVVLVKSLLRRMSYLSHLHCGREAEADYPGIIQEAEKVTLQECGLTWHREHRWSGPQQARLSLSGFQGSVVYRGPLKPFFPLLSMGELCHVGKDAVFGLGKYRVLK